MEELGYYMFGLICGVVVTALLFGATIDVIMTNNIRESCENENPCIENKCLEDNDFMINEVRATQCLSYSIRCKNGGKENGC